MQHDIYTLIPALEAITQSGLQKAPSLQRLNDLTQDPTATLYTKPGSNLLQIGCYADLVTAARR